MGGRAGGIRSGRGGGRTRRTGVALDERKLQKLRGVLGDMHRLDYSTRAEEYKETVITTDENGEEITDTVAIVETILEFEVTHKATAEMAVAYGFTPRQNEQLALLTGQEYTALWMTLLGGYVNSGGQIIEPDTDWVGTGIFAWPLPQSFTITSPFGYRKDPFTGEVTYHSGTDIAAPAGTPILGGRRRHGDHCQRRRPVGWKLWLLH